jgi:hypothetical protein
MSPTMTKVPPPNHKKQGKLDFHSTSKAGEPPSEKGKGEDLRPKKKGNGGSEGKKKARHQGTPPCDGMDKEDYRGIMDTDIGLEDARAEEASPVQAIALDSHFQAVSSATEFKVFQGL